MRKTALILMGFLLFATAAGALAYRWVIEPQRAQVARPAAERAVRGIEGQRNAPVPPAASRPDAATRSADRDRTRTQQQQQINGFQVFELAVDVLNVVVGLIGIALALVGMRMQREAQAAMAANRTKTDA